MTLPERMEFVGFVDLSTGVTHIARVRVPERDPLEDDVVTLCGRTAVDVSDPETPVEVLVRTPLDESRTRWGDGGTCTRCTDAYDRSRGRTANRRQPLRDEPGITVEGLLADARALARRAELDERLRRTLCTIADLLELQLERG